MSKKRNNLTASDIYFRETEIEFRQVPMLRLQPKKPKLQPVVLDGGCLLYRLIVKTRVHARTC